MHYLWNLLLGYVLVLISNPSFPVLLNQNRLLPCAALLEGEYGISGVYLGVPVILGSNGIERVVELELSSEENAGLENSANGVRELIEAMANAPKS